MGAQAIPVRTVTDLARVDRLIIPGGESTTVTKLLALSGVDRDISHRAAEGMPIWGTCMGLILLAREVDNRPVPTLGLLDVSVERNAYGSQLESFEGEIVFSGNQIADPPVSPLAKGGRILEPTRNEQRKTHNDERRTTHETRFRAPFIRAPRIRLMGPSVQVVATHEDEPVGVQQGKVLGTTFHPELTDNQTIHRYFLGL